MKRYILLILSLWALGAQGQNTLSLTGGSGHPGDTVTVTLSLANSDAVTALQTFIPLGDNLTYVAGSAALTSRSNGHALTATVLEGSLRLYSYSLALASYTGNSGALMTFQLVLGREPGAVSLTPTESVLSSATGSALTVNATNGTVTVLAPKVQVTPASLDYGHVPIRSSYTRTVTVKNIGNEPLTLSGVTFSDSALSLNTDQLTLNANAQQSVTLTYSPMVAGATTMTAVFRTNARVGDSTVSIVADPYSVNELRPLTVSGYTDSVVTVELRMNNMDSIVGLQTAIKLPTALTYVEGSFSADATRAQSYMATAGLLGDTLTLLMTSLTGTPMHGADGVVARFQLRLHGYGSHTLRLLNTALSDSTGSNVLSAVYTGTVSIYSPYLSCNSSVDLGNTPVTETATATLLVRNTGNAPLVVDRVVFIQSGWQLQDALPLTVNNNGRDTLHISYHGTVEGTHNGRMLVYTNDPRNEMKIVTLTVQRYEPNTLYMTGNADAQASMPEVDVMLDNYSAVTALQMDVRYPHNHFTLDPGDITLTERANGHIVSAARQDDSTLRVLLLSMQNSPFAGDSGAVARIRLHAMDSLSTESYPIMLLNVTTGCTDGVDRLSSIQSTGWFATRIVHDTTVVEVHDTTLVPYAVHDTTIVHDTTLVPYAVHDTTIVHDTTLVPYAVHDTTIVHDTTLVPYAVHDTTIIHDTTLVPYAVHDTTIIHDTTLVPYAVHDTTIIHDTTLVPYAVHDTTIVTLYDTVYINVPYPVHDTTVLVQLDTLVIHDTSYITVHDTLWLHDTVTIHDTIYITDEGIGDVEAMPAKVYQQNGRIVVEDPMGREVTLYDAVGRVMERRTENGERRVFDVRTSGVYLVKVEGLPARRVVVIR